jgi:hypothetical protein
MFHPEHRWGAVPGQDAGWRFVWPPYPEPAAAVKHHAGSLLELILRRTRWRPLRVMPL